MICDLTAQELYDRALFGIRRQEYESCRYRGDNGLKCTLGHAIDDEEYQPSMEGATAIDLLEKEMVRLAGEHGLVYTPPLPGGGHDAF